jgi:cytochrome c-type biogenesis protein CcmH/NrfG
MVVMDEGVMVAKVKLLKSRLPIKEKRKALEFKSAGTQHRHPRGSCCKKTVLLLLLLLVVVVVCCCWWWCCQGQQGQQQQQQRNRGSVLASP